MLFYFFTVVTFDTQSMLVSQQVKNSISNRRFFLRWADWSCSTVEDGGGPFKPICQKDKDSPDLTGPDPTTSTTTVRTPTTTSDNERILPDLLQCIDTGVKYKSKPSGKLQKINDVETAGKWIPLVSFVFFHDILFLYDLFKKVFFNR